MNKLKTFFVIAFALDIISTAIAFALGAQEANPIMHGWSIYKIAALKLIILIAVLMYTEKESKTGKVVLWYGSSATFLVAAWNLFAISQFILISHQSY